jgi:hypothetical protein
MKNSPPNTQMEVYEVEEGSDPPQPKDYTLAMLDIPPWGPPSVGDVIMLSAQTVPPGDNPYVNDANFVVLARTHNWLPTTKNADGTWSQDHTYKKTWLIVRRLTTEETRAGKQLV